MALPPQPFGNMVERGMGPAGPMDETSVDIPVNMPEDFAGGAQITEMPDGGALIEALSAGLEGMSAGRADPVRRKSLPSFWKTTRLVRSRAIWSAPTRTISHPVRTGKKPTPKVWIFWAFSLKSAALPSRAHLA
jgi:hypothetical protein